MNTIFALKNVTRSYTLGSTRVEALRGVNLTLEAGSYTSITGPSGSGKSSLLQILGCLDRPTSGSVSLHGEELSQRTPAELTRLRAKEIGFIFQAFHLNPILNAQENVAIALRFLGVPRREANQRAAAVLKRVGLGLRLRHMPSELSGGERQRVAIARALVKGPNLILADEPTGNLDSQSGSAIVGLLQEIHRERKTTIVQVTHDPEVASAAERILVMKDGSMVV